MSANQARAAVAALSLLALASCKGGESGNLTGPTTGDVRVTVQTSGPDADADGYVVALTGGASQSVAPNGSVLFESMSPGGSTVTISGVAANCTASGGTSVQVTVVAGSTATATFTVTCEALTGSLEVTTVTTGEDPDPDGYEVTVDGTTTQSVGTAATVTFADLEHGSRSVELTGLAENCSVSGSNPRSVQVVPDGTAQTTFTVECSAVTGTLEVTTLTTGGDLDDAYTLSIDGGAAQPIGANGNSVTGGLAAGDHTLELADVAANCAVTGDNPRSVTIAAGETTSTQFEVTCTTVTGSLETTTVTTGDDPDDAYTLSIDGGAAQAIGGNATLTSPGIAPGDRSVELTDVAANCTVAGDNPRTVTIAIGATTATTFDVSCTAVGDAYEPDNSAGEATPIGSGDIQPHSVHPAVDEDWVSFSLAAPSMVVLETAGVAGGDSYLELYTAGLVLVEEDDDDGVGLYSKITRTCDVDPLPPGDYVARVTSFEQAASIPDYGIAFTAVACADLPVPGPGFDIEVRYASGTSPTAAQETAFDAAATRWEELVIGDLEDVLLLEPFGDSCGGVDLGPLVENLDDLLIVARLVPIDGPGGILGQAGPCFIRFGAGNLPFIGIMMFDTADLAMLEASGRLEEVILHEMGHVLGYGTLWNLFGLLADPSDPNGGGTPGADTHFTGAAAIAEFDAIGGAGYTGGASVPVENDTDTWGSGSLDGHWRESVFNNELMTPGINAGFNPLSSVSVESLGDLGYLVNSAAADPFLLSFPLRAGPLEPSIEMVDDVLILPLRQTDGDGSIRRPGELGPSWKR